MRLRAFYTIIYNIRLGFIKRERKTSREKARAKPAKKTGSSRRSGSPRQNILCLGGADRGQKRVSGSHR